jgi:hypothetical protein
MGLSGAEIADLKSEAAPRGTAFAALKKQVRRKESRARNDGTLEAFAPSFSDGSPMTEAAGEYLHKHPLYANPKFKAWLAESSAMLSTMLDPWFRGYQGK